MWNDYCQNLYFPRPEHSVSDLLGVANYKSKLKLSVGTISPSGNIVIDASTANRLSLSLFIVEGDAALIFTGWSAQVVLSSTSSFGSRYSISLNASIGKYEITNNSSSTNSYSLLSLVV